MARRAVEQEMPGADKLGELGAKLLLCEPAPYGTSFFLWMLLPFRGQGMSQPNPSASRPERSLLKILANIAIAGFFAVGVVVAAGSFGLFGCVCTEGFTRRDKPADIPVKEEHVPVFPPMK